ncbi:MAG: carboxypeptidase-like regulatory domain-containing protein [Pyrinomonadaceae bacterium]
MSSGYLPGSIQVIAAGAGVEISGRALTTVGEEELGIRNASITLYGPGGIKRTVTTNSFGIYRFDDVARGENYALTATSKRYRFATRTVHVIDDVTDFDFPGLE